LIDGRAAASAAVRPIDVMPDDALAPEALVHALLALPGWSGDQLAITKAWRFASFADAITFMRLCIPGIETRSHHPEWTNVYNRVSARLRTHDARDRVTAADLDLAAYLDAIAAQCGGVSAEP